MKKSVILLFLLLGFATLQVQAQSSFGDFNSYKNSQEASGKWNGDVRKGYSAVKKEEYQKAFSAFLSAMEKGCRSRQIYHDFFLAGILREAPQTDYDDLKSCETIIRIGGEYLPEEEQAVISDIAYKLYGDYCENLEDKLLFYYKVKDNAIHENIGDIMLQSPYLYFRWDYTYSLKWPVSIGITPDSRNIIYTFSNTSFEKRKAVIVEDTHTMDVIESWGSFQEYKNESRFYQENLILSAFYYYSERGDFMRDLAKYILLDNYINGSRFINSFQAEEMYRILYKSRLEKGFELYKELPRKKKMPGFQDRITIIRELNKTLDFQNISTDYYTSFRSLLEECFGILNLKDIKDLEELFSAFDFSIVEEEKESDRKLRNYIEENILALSNDKTLSIGTLPDGTVTVKETSSGKIIAQIKEKDPPNTINISADNTLFITAGYGYIHIYDMKTSRPVHSLKDEFYNDISWSGEEVVNIRGYLPKEINQIALTADNKYIAASGMGPRIYFFPVDKKEAIEKLYIKAGLSDDEIKIKFEN